MKTVVSTIGLFHEPATHFCKAGEFVTANDLRKLGAELSDHLSAVATAVEKVAAAGWTATANLDGLQLDHPRVFTEADARRELTQLGVDPELVSFGEQDDDGSEEMPVSDERDNHRLSSTQGAPLSRYKEATLRAARCMVREIAEDGFCDRDRLAEVAEIELRRHGFRVSGRSLLDPGQWEQDDAVDLIQFMDTCETYPEYFENPEDFNRFETFHGMAMRDIFAEMGRLGVNSALFGRLAEMHSAQEGLCSATSVAMDLIEAQMRPLFEEMKRSIDAASLPQTSS